jgi:cathepsin F
LAVRNLATYGPAVVCVDASTWQDYAGGIITSDSGCSQQFMDVNHCVQAVGYAYMDSNGNDEEDSGSGDSGSNDNGNSGSREGYWIIRNQWSSYWGMNGYAYVAMGDNTCGVLNDMIQVYA